MKTVYGSFRSGITMGKCKTKTIQEGLGTFRHNQVYPGIIHAYSGIFRNLTYLQLWCIRTPVYSERWNIQNSRHIQNPVKHL